MADAQPVHGKPRAKKESTPKVKAEELQSESNPKPQTTYKLPDGTVVTQN